MRPPPGWLCAARSFIQASDFYTESRNDRGRFDHTCSIEYGKLQNAGQTACLPSSTGIPASCPKFPIRYNFAQTCQIGVGLATFSWHLDHVDSLFVAYLARSGRSSHLDTARCRSLRSRCSSRAGRSAVSQQSSRHDSGSRLKATNAPPGFLKYWFPLGRLHGVDLNLVNLVTALQWAGVLYLFVPEVPGYFTRRTTVAEKSSGGLVYPPQDGRLRPEGSKSRVHVVAPEVTAPACQVSRRLLY